MTINNIQICYTHVKNLKRAPIDKSRGDFVMGSYPATVTVHTHGKKKRARGASNAAYRPPDKNARCTQTQRLSGTAHHFIRLRICRRYRSTHRCEALKADPSEPRGRLVPVSLGQPLHFLWLKQGRWRFALRLVYT